MRRKNWPLTEAKHLTLGHGATALLLGGATLIALALTGCGRDRAPVSPADPGDPHFLSVPRLSDGTGDANSGNGGGKGPRIGLPIERRLYILPEVGGKLVNGRYTLIVPPNALPYDCDYWLIDDNNGYAEVELKPHAAVFNVPVTLIMDLRNSNATVGVQLFWLDDAKNRWVPMGGVYDPATMTLTTTLPHFSKYRAGW